MTETPKAVIADAITGEVTERPLSAKELAKHQAMAVEQADREAQAQAKADARTSALAKLADLGLTQDEINAL
jgi:hypothetical protein